MRKIKFRAWDPSTNKMFFPSVIDGESGSVYATGRDYENGFDCTECPLMQFTGLLDKNKKEIYEGDILYYRDGGDVAHHRIFWNDKAARWDDVRLEDGDSQTAYDGFEFVIDCKIIGNIYENPELL